MKPVTPEFLEEVKVMVARMVRSMTDTELADEVAILSTSLTIAQAELDRRKERAA